MAKLYEIGFSSHHLVEPPDSPSDFLSDKDAYKLIDLIGYRDIDLVVATTKISEVKLSGALTTSGGAWLEIMMSSVVNAQTGIIDWLPALGGTCGGELYLHLPGAEAGATYLGQLRCSAVPAYGQSADAYIAANVFGGQGGAQYGKLKFQKSPMVVPFVLPDAIGPSAWVAFHPIGMRSWRVYDVAIKKV